MNKWDFRYCDETIVTIEAEDIVEAVKKYNEASCPIVGVISITKVKEYICQVCGKAFEEYKEFQEHEANCLGLSSVEYNTYCGKKSWTGYCLRGYKHTLSDKDKEKYNRAVESLLEFEKFYGIESSEYELIGD